jgi:2-polyprenyl-3-methyl-5-hydroxy-6-metoxy-1,4-benzoquinol methylase
MNHQKQIAHSYNALAEWWDGIHRASEYGIDSVERAIRFCKSKNRALDIGCGAGGRITRKLLEHGFNYTGIDISKSMIELAKGNHPDELFICTDINQWQPVIKGKDKFDLIVAWDSLFHLPIEHHKPILESIACWLQDDGVFISTLGHIESSLGESHSNNSMGELLHYSSIGINNYVRILMDEGCICKHIEFDQFPENHVVLIVQKAPDSSIEK